MKRLSRSGDWVIAHDRVIRENAASACSASGPLDAVRSTELRATVLVPLEVERRSLEHTSWAFDARGQLTGSLKAAWQVILAALREVLDENAYERFLARNQDTRSAESYRAFLREGETAIARKPRCC